MSNPKLGVTPSVRIGDLLWCREPKSTKLWWPAMVTYDPKLSIYFRTGKNNAVQYHVQYFGITAYRGWVFAKSTLTFTDPNEKPLPAKGISRKTQREFEVAIREILEARLLDHKQRKLKFIFNFSPVPAKQQSSKVNETASRKPPKAKTSKAIKQERVKPDQKSPRDAVPQSLPVSISVKIEPNDSGVTPSQVSMRVESPWASSTQLGEPIRKSKRLTISTEACTPSSSQPQITPGSGASRKNVRHAPPLGTKRPLDVETEVPFKRPAVQDLGGCVNDNSSEVSAPSIASAILTPPNSCTGEEPPLVNFEFEHKGLEASQRSSSSKPQKRTKLDGATLKSGICSICDEEDHSVDLLLCEGQCYRTFHIDCLGLMQPPPFKFVCDECLIASSQCFVCGKAGGELVKCNKPKCSKLYHLACIEGNKLVTFDEKKKRSFTCPLHVCARCTSIGTSKVNHYNLIQCIKCPLALHKPDCLVAGCEMLGQMHMVCYQHVKIHHNVQMYSHVNLNTCLECGLIGTLYCCDSCTAAYHCECLDEDARPDTDAERWLCPNCSVHDLPTYGSVVICKYGKWRWWPGEVVFPNAIPDNLVPKKPGQNMFVVQFCGSHDYCWTYHGRTLPYTSDGGKLSSGRKWLPAKRPGADVIYRRACEEVEELYQSKQVAKEMRQKPDTKHYYKIKANKYLVPRPPLSVLESLPCQCTADSPCCDDSVCVNRASLIECSPETCPVGKLCQNQRILKCQYPETDIFYTGGRGWGLKAKHDIECGDFVIEYVGEVLDMEMCKERLQKAHENSTTNFYMLTLDSGLVIDACKKSNHARFINHSCDPNCETQKWTVRGETKIGIFACRDIPAGTELTFDYQLDCLGNERKQCLCGSKNCSGFLGLKSKMPVESAKQQSVAKPKKKKKARRPGAKPHRRSEREVVIAGSIEDTHEDDCFICGDGGELLLCDRKGCSKAYHLECLQRKVVPPKSQKWECPRHYCQVCQKNATAFCISCPVSYCDKHKADRFSEASGEPLCLENCCFMDTS